MKTSARLRTFITASLLFLTLHAPAVEPQLVPVRFTMPEVGTVGEAIKIQLTTTAQIASLNLSVVPHREVVKDAKAAGVTVPRRVAVNGGKATIPLRVNTAGEYHVIVNTGPEAFQLAIITEGTKVWIAEGTVGTLLQTRLMKDLKVRRSLSGKPLQSAFKKEYDALLKARAVKAKKTSGVLPAPEKALAVGDIMANDTLFFKAQWQGPKPADPKNPAVPADLTMFETFPIDGVKVQFRNAADNALVSETYLVNGVASFTAPSNSFNPKVTLIASFPGITATGGVQTAGGGIGTFDVEDGAGTTYSYDIPTPLMFLGKTEAAAVNFVFDRSAGRGGDNLAQMMAAFHCIADMVRELKKTIGQDKTSGFKVHFPQPGTTSFFGNDKKLHITAVRSYVWDVIGHEFGHMVQDDTSSINAQGGGHDGSNQYDYASNATTLNDKAKSNRLALNEGYGTWLGVAFTERSSRYANKFKWVGDKLYRDWVNLETNEPKFSFGAAVYKGEDTELAIQALLWDLHDANGDGYAATGLRDKSAVGMKFLFDRFKNKAMNSIFDVWRHVFVPSADMTNFTKASGIDAAALRRALDAAVTFAELGVAPHLAAPSAGEKIDLTAMSGPTVRWKQYATGNAAMDLNRFKLILYSNDLTETLWTSPQFSAGSAPLVSPATRTYEYELKEADLMAIKAATMGRDDASAVLVVLGTANLATATGEYLSNGVELLLQDFNRAMVAVVDSSGSNTSTDPTNQRVVASKESVRRLVSLADAMADTTKVPDIAAAIDFDSSVTILSQFADPDAVIPTLDRINSSGGTSIDGGINAGISLLDNISLNAGITGLFTNRAAILVFTDGQNNTGPGPVIAAIVNATLKGYRVHYGFLSPLVSPSPGSAPGSAGPGDPAVDQEAFSEPDLKAGSPTTIEEAVLCSGGVYAQIGDAQSQIAFVEQVFARGLTNIDGSGASGGLLIGQANTADQLTPENDIKSYIFSGQQNESVSVRVETVNFQPNVTVFDRDGNILAAKIGTLGESQVTLDLPPLPYTGEYSVQVYSEDGRLGLFNIFIDVQNIIAVLPSIESESELVLNRQTGLLEQTVVIRNTGGAPIAGFQIDISDLPDGVIVLSSADGGTSVGYQGALGAGESLELVIEYFNPARIAFVPTLAISADTTPAPPAFPSGFQVSGFRASDGAFVVEFRSVPGTIYYMQYSDDGGQNWQTTVPAIDARGTRVQWLDSGPPKTAAHPRGVTTRLYRVATP